MPNDYVVMTINDNTVKNGSPEKTTTRVPINPVTAGNLATVESQLGSLVTAIQGVTLGNLWKTSIAITEENPNTAAASLLAQRENKWRVTMVGGGETIRFTIGTADLSQLEANTENMAAGAARDALVAALGNLVKASDGTTAMAVQLPIEFVGRNI